LRNLDVDAVERAHDLAADLVATGYSLQADTSFAAPSSCVAS
jgi:hypothetical protein